jgi:hypothetical protein
MIFEMFILSISPNPFLDGISYKEYVADWDVEISYEVNDILLYFSFLRLYLMLKFVLYLTEFMGPRPQRVCHINNCDANTMFAVKGLMQQKPYSLLFWSLIITTVIFGF